MKLHDLLSAFLVDDHGAMRRFRDNPFLVRNLELIQELHVRQVILIIKPLRTDVHQDI